MNKSQRFTIVLFLLLPICFLLCFTYIPFFSVVIDSFFSMTFTQNRGFVGLQNYIDVLSNQTYNRAIVVSAYYMVAAVIQVVLALVLALLVSNCKFSNVYKALLTIPYMINGIAVGYIFRLFYTHSYVLDSSITMLLGQDLQQLPFWLRDQSINNWALAFASVWRYTGLSLIIFIGAIGSIEKSVFEVSRLDRASRWMTFRYIIWPYISKIFFINLFLSIVSSLSEFELPYAIASGGANGTATYMTLIYRIAFTDRKIGLASAMAVILLLQIILLVLLIYEISKIINRHIERKGRITNE